VLRSRIRPDDRVDQVAPRRGNVRAGLFGVIATREGLNNGREWLDATITALEANVRLLEQELANRLPAVRLRRPDASYLAWLDFTALAWGDDPAATALEHAKVALSSGPAFGKQGRGHARMNIGCHPETIVAAVDRLAQVMDNSAYESALPAHMCRCLTA